MSEAQEPEVLLSEEDLKQAWTDREASIAFEAWSDARSGAIISDIRPSKNGSEERLYATVIFVQQSNTNSPYEIVRGFINNKNIKNGQELHIETRGRMVRSDPIVKVNRVRDAYRRRDLEEPDGSKLYPIRDN